MINEIFKKNTRCLPEKIARMLSDSDENAFAYSGPGKYTSAKTSRSGHTIPCYSDGMASHSLYDPIREAAQTVRTLKSDSFVFFAGIGGGFHIREFLKDNPDARCAIAESNLSTFRSLVSMVDLSDIFLDSRVSVFPDCTSVSIEKELPLVYLPAMHGDFALHSPRAWEDRNKGELSILEVRIKNALSAISSDYSVQSHFGKIWFRNALINLGIAAERGISIPRENTDRIAIVAAAGPSLEDALPELKINRSLYCIFSTDTAYGTFLASGVYPDYFISVDAQSVSASHAMKGFTPDMNIVVDLCGNPDIAMQARRCGSNLIFVSGGHPFAAYASAAGGFPRLDTSSGTVTVAALDAAHALGFSNLRLVGADFAYTGGKPYARGTYLEDIYGRKADRFAPGEHLYSALIFRTAVERRFTASKLTYTNTVLDGYSRACRNYSCGNSWKSGVLDPFPFGVFLEQYLIELRNMAYGEKDTGNNEVINTLLPFFAWYRGMASRRGIRWNMGEAFQLAFDLIARYTNQS